MSDPIVSEHFAKAGLGVVLIDQQHGLVYLYLYLVLLHSMFRSFGREDIVWVFAKAREVPLLFSDGEGCRQHARPHQVRLPHKILEPEVQKSKVNPQPCIGCRCLWNRCSYDQQQGGRSKARRPVQVPDVPFGLFCTFCTFWYLCRLDTPAGLMVFSRYAPEGKRSWGPTRALAGDITPEQANAYVKVGGGGGGGWIRCYIIINIVVNAFNLTLEGICHDRDQRSHSEPRFYPGP